MVSGQFPGRLKQGYSNFRSGQFKAEQERYEKLAKAGQKPTIMIIACCDSRAAPETVFDASPGEVFVVRNVANLCHPMRLMANTTPLRRRWSSACYSWV